MSKLEVYSDGGSRNNGKPNALGGWGFVIVSAGDIILREDNGSSSELTTNNQNEIQSVIEALDILKYTKDDVVIYSDSAYVVNCINDKWYVSWRKNGWKNSKKKPVENKELWEELLDNIDRVRAENNVNVTFKKVKGHSGNEWNEYADRLVNEAMDEVEKNN